MIRLLIYAILFYFGYHVIKTLLRGLTGPREEREIDDAASTQEAELTKDPQCGVYFLKQNGVQATVGGQPMSFCSAACRDAYIKEHGA